MRPAPFNEAAKLSDTCATLLLEVHDTTWRPRGSKNCATRRVTFPPTRVIRVPHVREVLGEVNHSMVAVAHTPCRARRRLRRPRVTANARRR